MYLFLTGMLLVLGSIHVDSVDGAAKESFKTYKNYKVFRVSGNRQMLGNLDECFNEYEDIISHRNKQDLEVMVSPELLKKYQKAVRARHLKSTLLIDDFSEIIQKEKGVHFSGLNWTAYHDIDVIYGWLREMATQHPNEAKLVEGGKTYEGRDILGLRIVTSDPNGYKKPVVFIESGIHAREWIAPATTTYFINELVTSKDPNIRALRDTLDWHIFPSVNPDGYHYSYTTNRLWSKTRSKVSDRCYGVDANRNFDYNWGGKNFHMSSNDPCENIYAGTGPFSEVETRTLSEYLTSLGQILAYIDFHSNIPGLIIPFSDGKHAQNHEDLVTIGKSALKYGEEASGLKPYAGPGTTPDILYNVSGSSLDWAMSKLKVRLGFSFELRGYRFHWPTELIPEQGVEVTQMIRGLFVKAKELGYY